MSTSQPNVLWICTDQQRFDTLGCYGNEYVDTPNVDRLAAEGVRFDHCYSQSPVCTPSRASFLTGRYPRTTRCRQNGQAMPEDETLVTSMLADEGYNCGLAGKLHIRPCNPEKPDRPTTERRMDDGYAQFHWSHDTDDIWPNNEYRQWLDDQGVEYERTPVEGTEWVYTSVPGEYHQTTWCAARAVSFIETHEAVDRPWLFSVNPFDPHVPFDPPEEYLQPYLENLDEVPLPNYEAGELDDKPRYQRQYHEGALTAIDRDDLFPFPELDDREHRLIRAAYWAMCDLVDDSVGRMLDALERTGQRDETIVIFTSDHGEMLGDHGIYLKGPYFYDPAVRVPLVVSGPGIQEGVDSDAMVELHDLAPTLLDAVGLDPHPGMQAKSLWPLLTGETDTDEHRRDVYCEYYNAMPGEEEPELAFGTMVRDDRYKLAVMHRVDEGELYDLETDPGENDNLWADPEYQDAKSRMLTRLTTRMAETVDPLPERVARW